MSGSLDLIKDLDASQIMDEIKSAFAHVERGAGVTLHETYVIDMYGSGIERAAARLNDTDRHWSEVRDEWIEQFSGVGGLSFMDEAGFRYYLPAYMAYFLRHKEEPDGLTFYLSKEDGLDSEFEEFLTVAQRRVVARFLSFVCSRYQCLCPEAFERDWACYWKEEDNDITNRVTK